MVFFERCVKSVSLIGDSVDRTAETQVLLLLTSHFPSVTIFSSEGNPDSWQIKSLKQASSSPSAVFPQIQFFLHVHPHIPAVSAVSLDPVHSSFHIGRNCLQAV